MFNEERRRALPADDQPQGVVTEDGWRGCEEEQVPGAREAEEMASRPKK